MRIDSHQHFWKYDPVQYPWINEKLAVLKRDFLPEHLAAELASAGLEGCVAVQARQTVEESRWLLRLADQHAIIKGVVGWVDLRSPRVEEQLAELCAHKKFRGVRHVVQDEPDDNFMLGKEFQNGIAKLEQFNLAYDILIFPRQLPAAIELVRQFPEQKFVLDHIAKPSIRDQKVSPWEQQIRELAKHQNVWCKISGMVTEAKWHEWKEEDFKPYLDIVFEAFGEDRLMYGSDWPVCLLSASYQEVFALLSSYLRHSTQSVKERVLSFNAVDFYRLA